MPVERFQVTPSVTAGAYSANDVVGGLLTFKGLRGGTLQSVTITDKAAQNVDYLLVLFDDTPTGISDNATFAIADADLPKIIRRIDLTAASERQAFTDNAIYALPGLDIPLRAQCAALSAFLITLGAPAYVSTSDITVVLQVDTDYVSGRNQGTTQTPGLIATGDTVGGALSGTLPNPALATDAVNAIAEIAAALKTGGDAKLVTGTAGTSGNLGQWNGDGDLVDGPAASSVPSQADQTALEAETNEDTYAPPDLIKHSPGVAKLWGRFSSDGTIVSGSHNITSTAKTATGKYTVTIATDFSGTNYSPHVVVTGETTAASAIIRSVAAGTFDVWTFDSSQVLADVAVAFAAFGDQ